MVLFSSYQDGRVGVVVFYTMIERGNSPQEPQGYRPKTELANKPRLLETEELVTGALHQFSGQINNGELSQRQVETFVKDRVTGVKVNGVDVVSIDIHHEDQTIDPVMRAYMESDRTRAIVIVTAKQNVRFGRGKIGYSLMS